MFVLAICYIYFFITIRSFWLSLSVITFSNFRLICNFILKLARKSMAGLKEKFYTLILKFWNITFWLLTEPQSMLQLKILMAQTLFYCQVYSEFMHSVHSLLILCLVSIDLIYFSPLKFFCVLASSLVIVLKLFLIFGQSEPQCSYKVCFYKKVYIESDPIAMIKI